MSFGFITYKANGTPIIEPTNAGGLFLERLVLQPSGGSGVITYNYPGRSIRVFQVYPGCYTWSTGFSGGNPSLSVTRLASTPFDSNLVLLVFLI